MIISHRVLKDEVISIVDPVTLILNSSILSETESPWDSKKRESSLYIYKINKKGLRLDVGNYRLVSNLPVMSRILECNCSLKKHNFALLFSKWI